MAESEEQTLLAELDSDDWATVQDAVEVVGDWLRSRGADESLRSRFAERLLGLSAHPKWEVRKAVAHALLHLRHDSFHAAISRIIEDENSWVREAARKTLQRRTELTRSDIHGNNYGDAILGQLSDIEARYGPRARRAVLKIADRLQLRFVREAYHEIVRVIAPLDAALINLEREMGDLPKTPKGSSTHLRRARDRVRLLKGILEGLRDFSTEATGRFTTEEVLPILKEAEELALSDIDRPGTGLTVRYEVDASLTIDANRSRLLQALINIMANAVEACAGLDRPADLAISARPHLDSHVVISIADNGCGMSEEALQDCVQLNGSRKPGGMGFGLPLAKKVIEMEHQGTLSLESRLGEGTTVTVVLPVEQIPVED